jgi:hypothetical protein
MSTSQDDRDQGEAQGSLHREVFRAEAERCGRELGDEGDAALIIPRMRLRAPPGATQASPPFPSSAPAPTGNELPCPVQEKPTCLRPLTDPFRQATRTALSARSVVFALRVLGGLGPGVGEMDTGQAKAPLGKVLIRRRCERANGLRAVSCRKSAADRSHVFLGPHCLLAQFLLHGCGVVTSTSHTAAGRVPIPDRFSQRNF